MRAFATAMVLFCAHGIAAGSGPVADVFERLDGEWRGSGEVRGMSAAPHMVWSTTLDGAFRRLEFDNTMGGADGVAIRFRAHGYYRVAMGGTITGTWHDSRGVTLPLRGSQSDNGTTLTIDWGTTDSVERGRTVYRVAGDRLEVSDEVVLKDGTLRKFGETVLTRLR